jgi:hypothetical protein
MGKKTGHYTLETTTSAKGIIKKNAKDRSSFSRPGNTYFIIVATRDLEQAKRN